MQLLSLLVSSQLSLTSITEQYNYVKKRKKGIQRSIMPVNSEVEIRTVTRNVKTTF